MFISCSWILFQWAPTLWRGRVWGQGETFVLNCGNVLAGFLILDDSYRGARKLFSFATYARGSVQKLKAVCADSPASHTHPNQVVPSEHFYIGRSPCWTVALTPNHWMTLRPGPVLQQPPAHQRAGVHAAGGTWFRRAKTTADTWLGGSPDFLSLQNAPTVGVFVCLFHFVEVFHPNFL